MTNHGAAHEKIKVAICGGGIAGLCLLYGLLKQDHLEVTLYEASPEIAGDEGAGIGLAPNAIRALNLIDPELVKAAENADSISVSDPVARTMMARGEKFGEHIIDIRSRDGSRGFLFQRSKFIQQLLKLVPTTSIKTGHKLQSVKHNSDGSLALTFADGTATAVDALIGGDGIHSNVRKHVLSEFPNEVEPIFSKQYFYVTMAPMERAREKMGDEFTFLPFQFAWCGDQTFLMHDPANSGETLQVLVAVRTDETWEKDQWVKEKSAATLKTDLEPFRELGASVADLLAEQGEPLQARAVWEHPPASTYHRGHAAILGDAAHAMQPWQAAGAGQGIEDALILVTLLARSESKNQVTPALEAYTTVRKKRTQYAQKMSAECGEIIMNVGSFSGLTSKQMGEVFEPRWNELWYFDLEEHRREALDEMERARKTKA